MEASNTTNKIYHVVVSKAVGKGRSHFKFKTISAAQAFANTRLNRVVVILAKEEPIYLPSNQ